VLQFVAGPGAAAITLTNMTSTAWQVAGAVLTPQPHIAPKLPLPPGTLINLQSTRAGPLLQSADSCSSLQASGVGASVDVDWR
jgi:hypothetical protein